MTRLLVVLAIIAVLAVLAAAGADEACVSGTECDATVDAYWETRAAEYRASAEP
jgi:hypothetical protein